MAVEAGSPARKDVGERLSVALGAPSHDLLVRQRRRLYGAIGGRVTNASLKPRARPRRRGRQGGIMIKVGLLVRLRAKPGKEAEVAQFLEGALPAAQGENQTLVWFALRLGPREFGIFDAFADEKGRKAHLSGPIASALMKRAGELLSDPPVIEQVDVLAVKV